MRCVLACCSVLQCLCPPRDIMKQGMAMWFEYLYRCSKALVVQKGVVQCVAVCCGVLQCVAACCSVLQRVAVRYSVLQCVA